MTLKVLQVAHIDDNEYFGRMVSDDINVIIRDIRERYNSHVSQLTYEL